MFAAQYVAHTAMQKACQTTENTQYRLFIFILISSLPSRGTMWRLKLESNEMIQVSVRRAERRRLSELKKDAAERLKPTTEETE